MKQIDCNLTRPLWLSAILFLSFVLGSCASLKPIDEIPGVTDVDWTLNEGSSSAGPEVDAMDLRVGTSYFVSVKYLQRDKKGRYAWKRLVNYQGVTFASQGMDWRVSGQNLVAPTDPFAALSGDEASLTVRFPSAIGREVTKPVGLGLPTSLPSFRGADGDNGEDGTESDPDAENGEDGGNGTDLDVEIARYDLSGTRFESTGSALLLYDIRSNRSWLVGRRSAAVELDASGGAGGTGGVGKDRAIEEGSTDTFLQGGDGGDGGDGGNGGLVRMIIPESSSLDMAFAVNVSRGPGGKGGPGGDGDRVKSDNLLMEIVSVLMVNGSDGDDGEPGIQGRFWREAKPLDSMFLGVTSPYFERSRLAP